MFRTREPLQIQLNTDSGRLALAKLLIAHAVEPVLQGNGNSYSNAYTQKWLEFAALLQVYAGKSVGHVKDLETAWNARSEKNGGLVDLPEITADMKRDAASPTVSMPAGIPAETPPAPAASQPAYSHPAAQEWQEIATAPCTPGVDIMVWREDCGVFIARWSCLASELIQEEIEKLAVTEEEAFTESWFTDSGRLEGTELPTHWMPIPDGPVNKQ